MRAIKTKKDIKALSDAGTIPEKVLAYSLLLSKGVGPIRE